MKDSILSLTLFLFTLGSAPSQVQDRALAPPAVAENRQEPSGTSITSSAFADFENALKTAVERRDMAALQALYQTNGVSPQQLSDELGRWRPMLEGDPKARMSIRTMGTIFRDFNRSNKVWQNLAQRLTTHKATHLVELSTTEGYWNLPLVAVNGSLLLVPSDKSKDMGLRCEDIPANERPLLRPNPNSPSGPSSSRR